MLLAVCILAIASPSFSYGGGGAGFLLFSPGQLGDNDRAFQVISEDRYDILEREFRLNLIEANLNGIQQLRTPQREESTVIVLEESQDSTLNTQQKTEVVKLSSLTNEKDLNTKIVVLDPQEISFGSNKEVVVLDSSQRIESTNSLGVVVISNSNQIDVETQKVNIQASLPNNEENGVLSRIRQFILTIVYV